MIIYLARHGETPWNKKGLLQGHTNIPLSPDGEKQAEELRQELSNVNFSAAYCSDLSRARQTAEIVLAGSGTPLIETTLLRETNMGPFEGKHFNEVDAFNKTFFPTIRHLPKIEYLAQRKMDGIESYAEVYERFNQFLQLHAKQHEGETIFVATHGGFIRSILDHYDFSYDLNWKIDNCGYIRMIFTEKGPVVDHMHKVIRQGGAELATFSNP